MLPQWLKKENCFQIHLFRHEKGLTLTWLHTFTCTPSPQLPPALSHLCAQLASSCRSRALFRSHFHHAHGGPTLTVPKVTYCLLPLLLQGHPHPHCHPHPLMCNLSDLVQVHAAHNPAVLRRSLSRGANCVCNDSVATRGRNFGNKSTDAHSVLTGTPAEACTE